MSKEELMKWLQEQAHEAEMEEKDAMRVDLGYGAESHYPMGKKEAYNHVWRYLNEQEN